MTTIELPPKKCKRGDPIFLKVDPPVGGIKWSLSVNQNEFVNSEIKRVVPEVGFYLFKSSKDADGKPQEHLKKGDVVTLTINAGDAYETLSEEIEVT